MVVARDRYGIKPLFWTEVRGRVVVSAEVKGLLGVGWGAEWDVESLKNGGWNAGGEWTVFRGVRKVSGGGVFQRLS